MTKSPIDFGQSQSLQPALDRLGQTFRCGLGRSYLDQYGYQQGDAYDWTVYVRWDGWFNRPAPAVGAFTWPVMVNISFASGSAPQVLQIPASWVGTAHHVVGQTVEVSANVLFESGDTVLGPNTNEAPSLYCAIVPGRPAVTFSALQNHQPITAVGPVAWGGPIPLFSRAFRVWQGQRVNAVGALTPIAVQTVSQLAVRPAVISAGSAFPVTPPLAEGFRVPVDAQANAVQVVGNSTIAAGQFIGNIEWESYT